ncbi:MAG: HIT family protein [Saprospiraceae bacterium]|nr:HIT family protein [Saprospiraceae bacterium]
MASIFTKIINREIPCYFLAENEYCFSFLDIKPLAKGHALVIPKIELDYFFDLPDDILNQLMVFSKRMAHAIKQTVPCTKVGMSVIGLEVPHAHIHLVPLNAISELNFSNTRLQFTEAEYSDLAREIQKNYNSVSSL